MLIDGLPVRRLEKSPTPNRISNLDLSRPPFSTLKSAGEKMKVLQRGVSAVSHTGE